MPKYVWSAKYKGGQTIIKEVEAETVEESKNILLATGYSELKLKEEDIMATVHAAFDRDRPTFFGQKVELPADQRIKLRLQNREDPTTSFGSLLLKAIKRCNRFLIPLFLFCIYCGFRGDWITIWILAATTILCLTLLVCHGINSIYYKKLIYAIEWHQWDRATSLIKIIQIAGQFGAVKIPTSTLVRHRAQILTGMGKLDEALTILRSYENHPEYPLWLYKLHLAGLYRIAKQYDRVIECNLESIKEKPTSAAWAELASRYARHKRDVVKAREAMAEADRHETVDLVVPYRARTQGIIAYLEGDYATAKRELETSIEAIEVLKWRAFKDAHLSISRAYLSCVLAKQGNLAVAKEHFAKAKNYLMAIKDDELIAECRGLTGE